MRTRKSIIEAWKRAGIFVSQDTSGAWLWHGFPISEDARTPLTFATFDECLADIEAKFGTLD